MNEIRTEIRTDEELISLRRQRRILTTMAILLTGLSLWLGKLAFLDGDPDEDRPPIIVSNNGSVLIESQEKMKNGMPDGTGRGLFKDDSGEKWIDHVRNQPDTLGVVILGATPATCGDILQEIFTTDIDLVYDDGMNKDWKMKIHVGGKGLHVNAQGHDPTSVNAYTLGFQHGSTTWQLKSASIKLQSGQLNCSFARETSPRIIIYQHAD